jgi:hypothetical protein
MQSLPHMEPANLVVTSVRRIEQYETPPFIPPSLLLRPLLLSGPLILKVNLLLRVVVFALFVRLVEVTEGEVALLVRVEFVEGGEAGGVPARGREVSTGERVGKGWEKERRGSRG